MAAGLRPGSGPPDQPNIPGALAAETGAASATIALIPHHRPRVTLKTERTLSLIKPEAVAACHIGAICQRFEDAGLRITAMRMLQLTSEQAGAFYQIHSERPFYRDLVAYMCSGPIVAQVLEGKNAVERNRQIMGATNPAEAAPETIRADFGQSLQENAVHGSDSLENAAAEIAFFFADPDRPPAS